LQSIDISDKGFDCTLNSGVGDREEKECGIVLYDWSN